MAVSFRTESQAEQAALQAGADPTILARAKATLGSQAFRNLCERWVESVTTGETGQYPSAIAAWQGQQDRTRTDWENMQPGDAIYFGPNASNQGYGHTGIYEGGGTFINPGPNGVERTNLLDWINQTGQQPLGYIPQGNRRDNPMTWDEERRAWAETEREATKNPPTWDEARQNWYATEREAFRNPPTMRQLLDAQGNRRAPGLSMPLSDIGGPSPVARQAIDSILADPATELDPQEIEEMRQKMYAAAARAESGDPDAAATLDFFGIAYVPNVPDVGVLENPPSDNRPFYENLWNLPGVQGVASLLSAPPGAQGLADWLQERNSQMPSDGNVSLADVPLPSVNRPIDRAFENRVNTAIVDLERRYGRPLTDQEKLDIREGLGTKQTYAEVTATSKPSALDEEIKRAQLENYTTDNALARAKFNSSEKQQAFENALKGTPEEAALARMQLMQARAQEMRLSELASQRAQQAEDRALAAQMAQMATQPTAWAALASRGAKAEGPVNALDWYQKGQEATNLPADAYFKHLKDIGGAPDTQEMRDAWSNQYRTERGMGQPFALPSLKQMPWFQSISQGANLPAYRLTPDALRLGLSNQNFLQTYPNMTDTERQMLAGTAGSAGVNMGDWLTSISRRLPKGKIASRW